MKRILSILSLSALATAHLLGQAATPSPTAALEAGIKAAQMNAVAVFVSLLVWTWIWGVWGTLLAVPMMTMLKAVADHVDGLDWIGELLGEGVKGSIERGARC